MIIFPLKLYTRVLLCTRTSVGVSKKELVTLLRFLTKRRKIQEMVVQDQVSGAGPAQIRW